MVLTSSLAAGLNNKPGGSDGWLWWIRIILLVVCAESIQTRWDTYGRSLSPLSGINILSLATYVLKHKDHRPPASFIF
jgi:hypothetical protein